MDCGLAFWVRRVLRPVMVPRVSFMVVVAASIGALLAAGTEVTRESLVAAGLIKSAKGPAKLLANGEITHAVTVKGLKMSAQAREKIVAAVGIPLTGLSSAFWPSGMSKPPRVATASPPATSAQLITTCSPRGARATGSNCA